MSEFGISYLKPFSPVCGNPRIVPPGLGIRSDVREISRQLPLIRTPRQVEAQPSCHGEAADPNGVIAQTHLPGSEVAVTAR